MRILKPILVVLAALVIGALFYAQRRFDGARLDRDFWPKYSVAQVDFDARGIPTIEADDWEALMEAQGYVVASERFFHMDLLRRAAMGGLSELFGPGMVEWDRPKREEDWVGAADRGYEALAAHQKRWVDAYTRGVNAFLTEHPEQVGIEYSVLSVAPKPWKGRDSLLVLMIMAFQLSKAADEEAVRSVWQDGLPKEWFDFLYPVDHPFNRPLFGDAPSAGPAMPSKPLPKRPLGADELARAAAPDALALAPAPAAGPGDASMGGAGASNNWAWCGQGKCFLANDPHLGATVPHVWYAVRLRKSDKEWSVGVTIPGIPGVTIGMNPYLAWAFTNTGEDVDDYLEERLSEDGARYLARVDEAGEEVWADVEIRTYEFAVRGGEPVTGEGRFTHRGPLKARGHLDPSKQYSRQWLPLRDGMLSLPLGMNRAKSWAELNEALDEMRLPAQNAVMVDHLGNIGYRTSGTGVRRAVTGRRPQPALQGEWQGYEPYAERPRILIGPKDETRSATTARFLATANERLWVDEVGQRWHGDLRAERIRAVLTELEDGSHEDMAALQLDTVSRYHREVLRWVAARAKPEGEDQEALVAAWNVWDGRSEGHPDVTSQALEVESTLRAVALRRARALLPAEEASLPYVARMESAWMIVALRTEGGFEVFGFDEAELATALLAHIEQTPLMPHAEANRWRAQHPFVGRVPVVGDQFTVPEHPQPGHWDVPRVETPKYGASCRLVWDLKDPSKSTWALPVGQSGHVSSPHFSDFMAGFRAGESHPVFEDHRTWWFAPRGEALD